MLIFTFYHDPLLKWFEQEVNWKTFQTKNWLKNSSLLKILHQNSLIYQIDLMIFWGDLKVVSSDVAITRNCNILLTKKVVHLERNAFINAQYHRRESVEVNPVPPWVNDEELELKICKAFSLTGHEVKPDDL